MKTLEQVKDLVADFAKKKAELAKILETELVSVVLEIIKDYDAVETISWSQYTPYFNDGDTCEFRSNVGYPDINGKDKYDNEDESLKPLYKSLSAFLTEIPDEFYLEMFGDHCVVTINRDGTVDIDECEHD